MKEKTREKIRKVIGIVAAIAMIGTIILSAAIALISLY